MEDEKEESRVKKSTLALFSLVGLCFVWGPPFGLAEGAFFSDLSSQSGALLASRALMFATCFVSCLVVGLLGARIEPIRRHLGALWGCGVLAAAGALLGGLPALGLPLWLLYPGAAARGLAAGFLALSCFDRLAGLDTRQVGIATCIALASFGLANLVVMLLAQYCAPLALILLVAFPLLSCGASARLAKEAPERSWHGAKPEPMERRVTLLFAANNLVYGFLYGLVMCFFAVLATPSVCLLYALVAGAAFAAFALLRKPNNLSSVYRIWVGIGAAMLMAAVLLQEQLPALLVAAEVLGWVALTFFTIVMFTDVEYLLPQQPCFLGGLALAAADLGLLLATLIVPPAEAASLEEPLLVISMLAGMLYLALVFVSSRRSWVTGWGFSSFVDSESQETFRMRRCGELTAQHGLTKREFEVLQLLAAGQNKNEISEALVLSPLTVKTHIRNIYAKLGVHTQRELVELVKEGKVEEED